MFQKAKNKKGKKKGKIFVNVCFLALLEVTLGKCWFSFSDFTLELYSAFLLSRMFRCEKNWKLCTLTHPFTEIDKKPGIN